MIGFVVLELSKMIMADFYYNVMKKHYGSHCKLMYTDTDSLICHIISDHHPSEDFKTVLKDWFEQPETVKTPGLMSSYSNWMSRAPYIRAIAPIGRIKNW
jgi:hypothetical protein